MKRREKFCVILDTVLSVESSKDISLRNKMKLKSFHRDLFILRVNTEWLKKKLSSFSVEEMMEMKLTLKTLVKSIFSLFDDKTMEIRRNVWIFLGVLVEQLLSIDENYPMKTLQGFLPFEIQEFILSLKENLFRIQLEDENEEVFREALKMLISLFSRLTTKYSSNSFLEIFLLERSNQVNEEDEGELVDMFPKVNKLVQFFHNSWTTFKNSGHVIQQFLNILNVQQDTYHKKILPMYTRMTDDLNLRNLRFRYHVLFQDFIEEKKKITKKLFSKKKKGKESTGIFSYFFSSPPPVDNEKKEDEEEMKFMKKMLPILVSFINIFLIDPKFLTILLTQPNINKENNLVVIESTLLSGEVDEESQKEGCVNTVKITNSLLGTFFSLFSILTSVRSHRNRDKNLDGLKFILSELCLRVVNVIFGVTKSNQQLQELVEDPRENYHSLFLFREDLRSDKLRSSHHKNLNISNMIARICEHYLLNFTTKRGSYDLDSFKTSLNLLQYLFGELFQYHNKNQQQKEEENEEERIETRKISMNYLRVWEMLVGKLVVRNEEEKSVTEELRESISSLIEMCILEGQNFLHTEDRVSLIYEIVRNFDRLDFSSFSSSSTSSFMKKKKKSLIQFIGENSSEMIETGPHSLGIWKNFIMKDMFRKIEAWKVDKIVVKDKKKEKSGSALLHDQVRNLKQCVCRLISQTM